MNYTERTDGAGADVMSDAGAVAGDGYWAIVELFGHGRIIGYCTEVRKYGTSFLHVEVPAVSATMEGNTIPAYSRNYGGAAIYAETEVDEATARALITAQRVWPSHIPRPRSTVVGRTMVALPAGHPDYEETEDEPELEF